MRRYLLALWRALLVALFSGLTHYISEILVKDNRLAPVCDTKRMPYWIFLQQLNRAETSALNRLFGLCRRMSEATTDSEIQNIEHEARELIDQSQTNFFWQFKALTTPLRIANSEKLPRILDDIEKALLLRDDEIDWRKYGFEGGAAYDSWKVSDDHGEAYGYDESTHHLERMMIGSVALLHEQLIAQIASELNDPKGIACKLAKS
jgi:hypothetical protein